MEHGSSHSHPHAPKSFGVAFALGAALNIAFVADTEAPQATRSPITSLRLCPASGGHPGDQFLMDAAHALAHRFAIGHTTIQIETSETTTCAPASGEVV